MSKNYRKLVPEINARFANLHSDKLEDVLHVQFEKDGDGDIETAIIAEGLFLHLEANTGRVVGLSMHRASSQLHTALANPEHVLNQTLSPDIISTIEEFRNSHLGSVAYSQVMLEVA